MNYVELNNSITEEIKDIEELLKHPEKIDSLFNYSEIYLEEPYIYGRLIRIKEIMDQYIIHKIVDSNKTEIDIEKINNYFSVLYKYFLKNPTIYFSIPVFKFNDEIILKYLDKQKYKMIVDLVNTSIKKVDLIYNKFINNELDVTKEEYKFLIDYLTNDINAKYLNTAKSPKEIITKLLNSNKEYTDLRTKNFILKYLCNEKSKELNIKSYLYLCDNYDEDLGNDLGRRKGQKIIINVGYYRKTLLQDLRVIDENNNRKNTVLPFNRMIQSLYHEINHINQKKELQYEIINFETLSKIEEMIFIDYYGIEEYKRNYPYYEIEIDSNIFGINQMIKFFEEFSPGKIDPIKNKLVDKRMSQMKKRSYSYKQDEIGNKFLNEFYIVDNLTKILSEDPEKLNEYKILKEFYNDDGSLKKIDYMLLRKNDYHTQHLEHNIFDKYIIYHIAKGNLNKLNLNEYNLQDKQNILLMLENIFFSQIKSLFNIKNSYKKDENLQDNLELILKNKVDIINYLICFFDKYYNNDYFDIINNSFNNDLKNLQVIIYEIKKIFKIDYFKQINLNEIKEKSLI